MSRFFRRAPWALLMAAWILVVTTAHNVCFLAKIIWGIVMLQIMAPLVAFRMAYHSEANDETMKSIKKSFGIVRRQNETN